MAQISSYSTLTPQLGDKVLGSNTTDSSGNPVLGNPTCQFSLTAVKTLVDQDFIQQFSSSSNDSAVGSLPTSQNPVATNTVHQIIFGLADSSSANVVIDAAGKVTFNSLGTYYITQEYCLGGTAANALQTMFRTLQDGTTQVGSTCMERYTVQATTDRQRVVIEQMVNITVAGTYYVFQMIRDANGANDGILYQQTNNNAWTTVPTAQLTISKLI